jgi:hypothetical protein
MNDLNIDYINDILSTSVISHKNLISETLLVDSNPAKVESIEVKKIDSKIVTIKNSNEYNLESKSFTIKNLSTSVLACSLSLLLDNAFINSFKNNFSLDETKFYRKGLMRLFGRPRIQSIIDESEFCDWLIVTPKVFKYLSKHKNFQDLSDDKITSIKLKGRINQLSIFVCDYVEKDVVYKGKSSDSSSVMLNELNITQESNIYNVKVDYLFINKGIRKLILL